MNVCRFCIRWTDLPLEVGEQKTLDSIHDLFGLKIERFPGMAQHACENCLLLLEYSAKFYDQLVEAENTLQTLHKAGMLESLLADPKGNGELLQCDTETLAEVVDADGNEPEYYASEDFECSEDLDSVHEEAIANVLDCNNQASGSSRESLLHITIEGGEELEVVGSPSKEDVERAESVAANSIDEAIAIDLPSQPYDNETMIDDESIDSHDELKATKGSTEERASRTSAALKGRQLKSSKNAHLSVECFICRSLFPSQAKLQHHLIEHSDLLPYHCNQCSTAELPMEAETLDELNNHMKTHTYKLVCNACPMRFRTYPSWCEHISRVHSSNQLSHSCTLCGMHFVEQRKFLRHMNAHRNKDLQRYKCATCGKVFQTSTLLKRHELIHLVEDPFVCAHCARGFKHEWNYKQHLLRHTQQGNVYRCEQCGLEYANFLDWRRHMREHFPEDSRYWEVQEILPESLQDASDYPKGCAEPGCTYLASSQQSMLEHYRTHLKPFRCERCPQKFANAPYLRQHINLVHWGLRPHECAKCGKRFGYRHKLLEHLNMHDGVRNLKCRYCDKRFTNTSNLTVHERVHTKARPYTCDLCGSRFRTSSAFAKHRGQLAQGTGLRVASKRCVKQQLKQRQERLQAGHNDEGQKRETVDESI